MDASKVTSIPYQCPGCGAWVGRLLPAKNEVRLDAGKTRYCPQCGRVLTKRFRVAWAKVVQHYLRELEEVQESGAAGGIPYECPRCHRWLGRLVPQNGEIVLYDDSFLIRDGEARCCCGQEIHFISSREPWLKVVQRYLKKLADTVA